MSDFSPQACCQRVCIHDCGSLMTRVILLSLFVRGTGYFGFSLIGKRGLVKSNGTWLAQEITKTEL